MNFYKINKINNQLIKSLVVFVNFNLIIWHLFVNANINFTAKKNAKIVINNFTLKHANFFVKVTVIRKNCSSSQIALKALQELAI